MPEEPYERYVASFRTLIENHGVKNAVYVFEKALMLELREEGLFDKEKKSIDIAAKDMNKLYFKLGEL